MSVIDQLNWRYATKQFDPEKKIDSETWSTIEESLLLTPSSFGLQPWHFLVVTDQAKRDLLPELCWGQTQPADCSHYVILAALDTLDEAYLDKFLADTAAKRGQKTEDLAGYKDMMIGFFSQMDDAAKQAWAKNQVYIALGQLMAIAAQLGIDACPMEGINPPEFDKIFGLNEKGYSTSVACALGYRSDDDQYAAAPKIRYSSEELITRI